MKHLLLSLVLLLTVSISQATIFRVGYNGSAVPYRDFSYGDFGSAQYYASAGDTIQIYQQINTTTTGIYVTKPLVILGFGHSLNSNSGYQILNNPDSSLNYASVQFSPGSEGSIIEGLNISSCSIYTSDITVTRCRFKWGNANSNYNACGTGSTFLVPVNGGYLQILPYYNNINNVVINGCFFDRTYNDAISFSGSYNVTNLLITNNYFNATVNLKTNTNGQINGVFANNIMNFKFNHLYDVYNWNSNVCTQGAFSNNWYYKVSNFDFFLIKNNIFNTEDTVTCPLNAPNSIIQNNIFTNASQYACVGLGGANNIYKAVMSTVFSAAWNNGFVYNDNQLALGAGSVAINAGVKGNNTPTNCGVFGGESEQDYKLGGIPSVPSIYQISTPGVNATTNPYNITISVKSNK